MLSRIKFRPVSSRIYKLQTRWNSNYETVRPQRALWKEPNPTPPKQLKFFRGREGVNPDFMAKLQRRIDFRPEAIQNWFNEKKRKHMIAHQSLVAERRMKCGYEVGGAHFVLEMNGAVRFKDYSDWIKRKQTDKKNDNFISLLPIRGSVLQAVDLSGTNVMYEGLDNLIGLRGLEWLSLKGCPLIDDWCLDKISANFRQNLKHLDLSECPNVTDNGLAVLHRLNNLKSLHLNNLPKVSFGPLVSILLEDAMPGCKIFGIDSTKYDSVNEEDNEMTISKRINKGDRHISSVPEEVRVANCK